MLLESLHQDVGRGAERILRLVDQRGQVLQGGLAAGNLGAVSVLACSLVSALPLLAALPFVLVGSLIGGAFFGVTGWGSW